ncbi:hypothetical protein ACFSGX_15300 [Sphingomonas arantia]|uniref:Uncharacterized protein n=1 Tax=Sphingomonas arantia TaxID=1460676 RepID=A0ABW4TZH2_9SPHN
MPSPTSPNLSRTEWAAVAVALQDTARCGCTAEAIDASSGSLRRLTQFLFGRHGPTPLADPRLEAVRRFVCASHVGSGASSDLAKALTDHGFSQAQIDALDLLSR